MAEPLRGLLYIFGVRYCTNLQVIPATATPKMNFFHPVLTTFLFILTTINKFNNMNIKSINNIFANRVLWNF